MKKYEKDLIKRNLEYIFQVATERKLDTGVKVSDGVALLEIADRVAALRATLREEGR